MSHLWQKSLVIFTIKEILNNADLSANSAWPLSKNYVGWTFQLFVYNDIDQKC